MAEYIERENYCENVCHCANEYCDKESCPIWKAPAADVAPVMHGRWISWIEVDDFIPAPRRHECSVCYDVAQVLVNGVELLSAYCPNCGARMDGGDNTER